MATYSRRVSFDNLYPIYIDPSNPLHEPPQFHSIDNNNNHNHHHHPDTPHSNTTRIRDLNFGFGGAAINNIEEYYTKNNYNSNANNGVKRKVPKLPPPPSRSILKKKAYNDEINYTIENPTTSVQYDNNNDNAIESESDDDDSPSSNSEPTSPTLQSQPVPQPAVVSPAATQTTTTTPRRKSFADMTNEELAALEDSYAKKSTLNIESFNFTNTPSSTYIKPTASSSLLLSPDTANNTTANSVSSAAASAAAGAGATGTANAASTTDTSGIYPSRPVIDHGACCITCKHESYDKLYPEDRLLTRTLFCMITGRRHTWNAIDYMIDELAKDGDHLVITSQISVHEIEQQINNNLIQKKKSISQMENSPSRAAEDEAIFESSRYYNISSNLIYEKCQNIMKYALDYLSNKKTLLVTKISVEIINCDTSKQVFHDGMKLYKPHLCIIGSKTDEGYSSSGIHQVMSITSSTSSSNQQNQQAPPPPLQHRRSSTLNTLGKGYNGYYRVGGVKCMKLTSYLIENSKIPVIVVTDNYHLAQKCTSKDNNNDTVEIAESYFKDKLITISDQSRQRSIYEIIQQEQQQLQQRPSLTERHSSSLSSTNSPQTFHQNLSPLPVQSQAKVKFGDDLDFGHGHTIYKVKSLLDPVDNSTSTTGNAVSRQSTRSSLGNGGSSSTSTSNKDKEILLTKTKKKGRSKSDSSASSSSASVLNNNNNNTLSDKISFGFKKFGFGKK